MTSPLQKAAVSHSEDHGFLVPKAVSLENPDESLLLQAVN
jgi:hypothetical protein